MISTRVYRVLAVSWTVIMIIALSLPGESLPSGRIWEFDKLIHAGIFLVFAWLWMHALDRPARHLAAIVLISGVAFAWLSEVYQGLLPFDRRPDPVDAISDTIGLLIGVAAAYLAPMLSRRK